MAIFVLFFLGSESQVTADLTEVSFVPVWYVSECRGVQEDGEEVVKVVECMLLTPWGLENPFQARCEEIRDRWRCAAAERDELVAPPSSHPSES